MLPRYLEDLYTLTYQEDSLDRDEEAEDPEIPAWGASRYKCSNRSSVGELTGKISYRAPLRSPQPLASLQVGRQAPRHGLVRYFPALPFNLYSASLLRSASSGPLSLGGAVGSKTGEGEARLNFTRWNKLSLAFCTSA